MLRKHGVDPRPFHELIAKNLFRSPVYENYGNIALSGRYELRPSGWLWAEGT